MLDLCKNKRSTINGYGSAKHCKSIDLLFDLINEPFILLDSDTLVKTDLSSLYDSDFCAIGQIGISNRHIYNIPRFLPFVCYINVPLCKKFNINYFNIEYMFELHGNDILSYYDTGAYFLKMLLYKQMKIKNICCGDYIEHLNGGSSRETDYNTFLEKNKHLYE